MSRDIRGHFQISLQPKSQVKLERVFLDQFFFVLIEKYLHASKLSFVLLKFGSILPQLIFSHVSEHIASPTQKSGIIMNMLYGNVHCTI